MKKEKEFWDGRAEKYDVRVAKKYSKAYDDTVKKSLEHLNASEVVLELACGTGITTVEIAKHIKKIYAVDLSQNMIDVAKGKAGQQGIKNIEFSVCAIDELNFPPESFDAVTAFNVLCYLRKGKKTIGKIHEMLKPGGVFLSATDCLGESKKIKGALLSLLGKAGLVPYVRRYGMDELYDTIKRSGFEIMKAENLYDTPPNYFIAAKKE